MDIRGLGLPGICIWVFYNLTLLQRDASAPPVIYHSIKPILYYNLIHLPLVQTKAMSVLCHFSKAFCSSTQLLYFCSFPPINGAHTSETQLRIITKRDVHVFCLRYIEDLKILLGNLCIITKIYPSIFCLLSGVRLQWQQAQQGIPDIPLPDNAFLFLLGNPKGTPGEMRYVISPASSGSALGSAPKGCAKWLSQASVPRKIISAACTHFYHFNF